MKAQSFALALAILLAFSCGQTRATEQTPDQIRTSAASTFTANGAGGITGPEVGSAITNIADSFIPKLYATSGCYWKSNGIAVSASCEALPAAGTVSSVGASFTGGLISVTGSPVTTNGTLALSVAGVSGGIPYFSSTSTWATSAALTNNAIMTGGGAGAPPKNLGSLGSTTTVLHGNAAGAPTFGAVSLTADVSGVLPIANLPAASAANVQAGTSVSTVITPNALSGAAAILTLVDAATITWDVSTGFNAKVTLTANRTIAAPTNVIAGRTYRLTVIQDGVGSRLMTWNAVFKWGAAGAPTLSIAAGAKDVVTCFAYDSSNLLCSAVLGF